MPKILLADDSPSMRLLLRAQLESLSVDLLEAADGPAALELARSDHPPIAVLDFDLPKLNAFEVCTRLKAEEATRDISVFILPESAEQEVQGYAFGAGADYFFAKAWGTRALAQMLADVMSR